MEVSSSIIIFSSWHVASDTSHPNPKAFISTGTAPAPCKETDSVLAYFISSLSLVMYLLHKQFSPYSRSLLILLICWRLQLADIVLHRMTLLTTL